MEKEYIINSLNDILQSHANEIDDLLSDGHRVVITLKKGEPNDINVTKQIDTLGRNSGIRIIHDGNNDVFSSREALLFSIREIGCEQFYNAQKRGKVVFQQRPVNTKDSSIAELQEKDVLWYVNLNGGINQRINFLNNIFKELGIDWFAERKN